MSRQKITLGSALEKAKGEARGSGYVIRFAKAFDLDMAKRSAALLEGALQALAGRPVALELELGAAEAPPTDIVDAGAPEPVTGAEAPPGTRWKDIAEPAPGGAPAAGALKSAEGVFGGKARIVKKKSGE
ncbi:MAG: hypothetical protein M0D55_00675 [Elusimicrobiota bacterium]|nr:MAG: hypothetical protein M0D55_00675 [Elusimicrobiota bacterium]